MTLPNASYADASEAALSAALHIEVERISWTHWTNHSALAVRCPHGGCLPLRPQVAWFGWCWLEWGSHVQPDPGSGSTSRHPGPCVYPLMPVETRLCQQRFVLGVPKIVRQLLKLLSVSKKPGQVVLLFTVALPLNTSKAKQTGKQSVK